jgi:hypothetical protein
VVTQQVSTRYTRAATGSSATAIAGYRRPRPASRFAQLDSPWAERDLIRSTGLLAVGLIVLAICWYGVSGEANFHRQIVWIAAASGGIVVAVIGLASWLLAGLRTVHNEMHEVAEAVRVAVLGDSPAMPVDYDEFADLDGADLDGPEAARPEREAIYVIGAGMTRVHLPSCRLVRGKLASEVSRSDIEARGLRYCEVCCG